MKLRVTEKGVVIPKAYLKGIEEVEIKKENGLILIVPITDTDPLLELGKNPVQGCTPDAAEKHDKYLYDSL